MGAAGTRPRIRTVIAVDVMFMVGLLSSQRVIVFDQQRS